MGRPSRVTARLVSAWSLLLRLRALLLLSVVFLLERRARCVAAPRLPAPWLSAEASRGMLQGRQWREWQWQGAVVFRRPLREVQRELAGHDDEPQAASVIEFCVIFDPGRGKWEIPKGGPKRQDASPYDTSVRELWEEAGVWLTDRRAAGNGRSFRMWVNKEGQQVHDYDYFCVPHYLVTEFRPGDGLLSQLGEVCDDGAPVLKRPATARAWMTAWDFRAVSARTDHADVLFAVDGLLRGFEAQQGRA